MAQRMLSLAVQGTNGTLTQANRTSIKNELVSLMDGINGISTRTKIGSTSLFTVKQSQASATSISVFAGSDSADVVSLNNSAFKNIGASYAVVGTAATTAATSITLSVASPSTYSSTTQVYKLSSGTLYSLGTVSTTNVAGSTTLVLDRGASQTSNMELVAGDVIVTDTSEYGLLGKSATTVAGRSVLEAVFNANLVSATTSTAQTAFQSLTTAIGDYITLLSTQRGLLGAYQNQMEYSVNNVTELSANLTSARSRVVDTDYASETANLTKGQILQQAATAMLAQANQMPNVILSLLK